MKTNLTGRGEQTIPANPDALWDASKRILYTVARKVKAAVRRKLAGHGRSEAEVDELVNDSFVCLMEALPRFDPAAAKLTTFVYGLARRRMWLVARAAFYGLSPEQMHRMDVHKQTPRFHRGERTLRATPAPVHEEEQRSSARRVDAIRRQLPREDQRLVDLYLQESACYASVARRLRRHPAGVQGRYYRLFRRIAATA